MAKRYRKRIDEAIQYLGGKCVDCGSDENLEFDHKDGSAKIKNVTSMASYSNKTFWKEVDKCELRCHLCHNRRTILGLGRQDGQVVHGTLASYRYCKCDVCRKVHSDYMKDYSARKKTPT